MSSETPAVLTPAAHDAEALVQEAIDAKIEQIRETENALVVARAQVIASDADIKEAQKLFDAQHQPLIDRHKANIALCAQVEKTLADMGVEAAGSSPIAVAIRPLFELLQFKGKPYRGIVEGTPASEILSWTKTNAPMLVQPEWVKVDDLTKLLASVPVEKRPTWYIEREDLQPQVRRKELDVRADAALAEQMVAEAEKTIPVPEPVEGEFPGALPWDNE